LGSQNNDIGINAITEEDMDIIIHSLELVPYDETQDNYKLDLSDLIIDDIEYQSGGYSTHSFLDDGSLKISFVNDPQYVFLRIALDKDRINVDCSKYKYLKVVSDYKQPYLIGFSDVAAIENDPFYTTSEYGDLYSYAQDNQYEVATYIYALRYEEFIALNTKKIQMQDEEINKLKERIAAIEDKLK
jgi:hypothetical protein